MFEDSVLDNQKERHGRVILSGRQKIYSPVENISKDNLIDFLLPVLSAFSRNKFEMEYLYWYRRGIQPVLWRTKEVRKEICARTVVNLADEISIFKNGYFLTKPAFYISRSEKKNKAKAVDTLNEYLYMSGKHKADNEVVNWFHTVGVGVIYLEANKEFSQDNNCPLNVYALDPRTSFVVYSLNPGNPPLAGINLVSVGDGEVMINVYTKDWIYTCRGGFKSKSDTTGNLEALGVSVVSEVENAVGEIPMVEYTMNRNRMACFESVIPLLDGLNQIVSNQQDGIEQFIQSLCVATNCQFEEGTTAETIRNAGMITLTSTDGNNVDFKILSEQLDQTQTQTAINNLLDRINSIAGVPFSTQSTGGTSDNVGAVYLRNGYEIADTFVRDTEDCFRDSNKQFDKVMLKILRMVLGESTPALSLNDIDIQFSRSECENLLTKSQSALNLMQLGLSPEVILEKTGLSNDPISDISRSEKYIKMVWDAKGEAVKTSETAVETDNPGMDKKNGAVGDASSDNDV